MNFFKNIQLFQTRPSCQNCLYFQNDPSLIEQIYPGLTSLSSGFASVRDQDGFCKLNQLYLSAKDSCLKLSTDKFN